MLRKYVHDPTHVLDYASLQVYEDFSYEELLVQILDQKTQVLHNKIISMVKVF